MLCHIIPEVTILMDTDDVQKYTYAMKCFLFFYNNRLPKLTIMLIHIEPHKISIIQPLLIMIMVNMKIFHLQLGYLSGSLLVLCL